MPSLMQRTFSAVVRDVGDAAIVIIDLHGEINNEADGVLDAAFSQALGHSTDTILLNFGDVDYINSTGIALIVGILASARKAKRRLVTYGLSDHYLEIFQITRLSDFMANYADEQAALLEVMN